MGWNDHIDVSDLEQEICVEWYPNYDGEAYNHPNYDKIYMEALNRFIENKIDAADGRRDETR
mgnify:CR=1 FL=1